MSLFRRAVEKLSHGVTLSSRLPARFGDFPLLVSPDARLGFWSRNVERIDPRLIAVAEEFVKPGMVVWDIGANVGVFALVAAALAGPPGFVLAVDGDTWLVDLLRRTCRLPCDPRAPIDVLPAAIDREVGIAQFNIASRGRAANFLAGTGSTQTGGAREGQRVMAASLDWLLDHFRPPDIVKIDVEGAELRALEGAGRLLAEVRPIVICEVSQRNAREITDLLTHHGYALHDREYEGPSPRPRLELAVNDTIAIPH